MSGSETADHATQLGLAETAGIHVTVIHRISTMLATEALGIPPGEWRRMTCKYNHGSRGSGYSRSRHGGVNVVEASGVDLNG